MPLLCISVEAGVISDTAVSRLHRNVCFVLRSPKNNCRAASDIISGTVKPQVLKPAAKIKLVLLVHVHARGRGVALRSRRQLGKEKGVESREKERDRRGGRETAKEHSPIKSSRIQARLYPARLSRLRRPHRKLRNAPLALTHTHSLSLTVPPVR